LDNSSSWFKHSKKNLAGCRYSNSRTLAFGGNLFHLLQEQQKNIMVLLGQQVTGSLNTARSSLSGAGTQTAALGFGGMVQVIRSNRRIRWFNLDNVTSKFSYSKKKFRRCRNTTISFSFWWANYSCYSSNRRIHRCRSTINKNNNGKLIWQNI
jgi:hypothetical protein